MRQIDSQKQGEFLRSVAIILMDKTMARTTHETGRKKQAVPAEAVERQLSTNEDLSVILFQATGEIQELRHELHSLQRSLPNSMILDQNLLKRALAVYGHMMLISLILGVPLFCLQMLVLYSST
jgi:hypothetical protein